MVTRSEAVHLAVSKGQSIQDACKSAGLQVQSYYSWRSKHAPKKRPYKTRTPKVRYTEIPLEASQSAGSLQISGDPLALAAFLTGLAKGLQGGAQ